MRICRNQFPYDCEDIWLDNGATEQGNVSFYLEHDPPEKYAERNEIVGITNVNLPMRNLCNVVHIINATHYHYLNNNCYNINAKLCEYLGQRKCAEAVKHRENQIAQTSITNTAIIGATALGLIAGIFVGGAVGIGVWGIANSALYLRNWQRPKKLDSERVKWFHRFRPKIR